jgi:hypothetical protein
MFSVRGGDLHHPVEDRWPFPKQPPIKSLLALPLDLSRPPAPGSLLDSKYYTGKVVHTEPDFFTRVLP